MNVVVLQGCVSRPPVERALPDGSVVVAYEVAVRVAGERGTTVPVVWADPPVEVEVSEGEEVVVTGRVERRFFRAGGVTQSRTEVVADAVVPVAARRRARAAVDRALGRVER